jgi:nitrile hydratase
MHDHDHDHPDGHPTLPDQDTLLTDHQRLETAVRELLIEKGLITADEVRRVVEVIDSQTPAIGARVVARAWVDPAYRARLLANGAEAVKELGIDMGTTKLVVVENTPQVHNLIVCTLCSCYPRPVLGLPPDSVLPEGVAVRVHDSTAEMRYLVLPMRPQGTVGLSEAELAELVTRDSMVGVSLPLKPEPAAAAGSPA